MQSGQVGRTHNKDEAAFFLYFLQTEKGSEKGNIAVQRVLHLCCEEVSASLPGSLQSGDHYHGMFESSSLSGGVGSNPTAATNVVDAQFTTCLEGSG